MGKREWMSLVVAVVLAACAGDTGEDEPGMAGDTGAVSGTAPAGGGPTATTPAPPTGATGATGPGAGTLPEGVTQEMVAAGKTVFESTAPCYTCHGMDGSGSALAPNLRDAQWINTDGTMQGIEGVVRNGVAQPKQFPAPMPAMGGAQLSDQQVRAVSAYVYSISRGG